MSSDTHTKVAEIGAIVANQIVPILEEKFFNKWMPESSARKGIVYQLNGIFHGFVRAACYIRIGTRNEKRRVQGRKFKELVDRSIEELQIKFTISFSLKSWDKIRKDLETIAVWAGDKARSCEARLEEKE